MTQEQNDFSVPGGSFDISRDVDQLMDNTNEDMSKFRDQIQHLMANVSEVVTENQQLRQELARYKLADTRKPAGFEEVQQRSQMTEDALANALKQIDSLRKERESLKMIQECSVRTIDNMERELTNYRKQLNDTGDDQIINKYIKATKILEQKLESQKKDLDTQAEMIQVLHEHKQRNYKQLLEMQAKLQEHEHCAVVSNEKATEIANLKQQVLESEQRLHHTQQLLKESNKREEVAMAKVQEALNLSESAVREKTDAEKRSESYKEELVQLAKNMGIILKEEAKRVDNEVAMLRSKQREKLQQDKAQHMADMQALLTRYTRLEKKYNEALDQNEKLDAELDDTRKRLSEDMQKNSELKLNESRVNEYIQQQRQINAEYKEARKDLTIKFQREVRRLMDMNSELKAEIAILKGDENSRDYTM